MRYRRVVGPTIVSIVLCLLLADHLFFSANPWSISQFLGRFFSTVAAIFVPASPGFYNLIGDGLLPMAVGVVVFALFWLILARAMRAMNRATAEPSMISGEMVPAGVVPAEPINTDHRDGPVPPQRDKLFRRLLAGLCAVAVVFGIVTNFVVYSRFRPIFEGYNEDRAGLMVLGLSDLVGPALSDGRLGEVSLALDVYASRHEIVYAYVEDGGGRIVAHWPGDLLRYLKRDFPSSSERALRGINIDYRGASVYEISRRLGERNSGFVHVAVDVRNAHRESGRLVVIAGALTTVILLGGTLVIGWRARRIFDPWSQIVEDADRISRGDFAVGLPLQRTDEIGEIARSLERMRSSLRAVTTRLESGQIPHHGRK